MNEAEEISKRVSGIELEKWQWECAKNEAKLLTGGNVNALLSEYLQTLFKVNRKVNK